jgi:thioredoxin reductase
VPGEDLTKVVYTLIDPAQYAGRRVLIVGGGDSALEAAYSIADEPGAEVTLSYRGTSFARAKRKNRDKVERYATEQRIRLLLESEVEAIEEDRVALTQRGQARVVGNDAVIICVGGILPTGFLRDVGIQIETKYGQA